MLRSLLGAGRSASGLLGATSQQQLQQWRFLNIHEYQVKVAAADSQLKATWAHATNQHLDLGTCESQGAQLMSKFGINVPDGVPAFSVKEVEDAAKQLADEKGEVRLGAMACTALTARMTQAQ